MLGMDLYISELNVIISQGQHQIPHDSQRIHYYSWFTFVGRFQCVCSHPELRKRNIYMVNLQNVDMDKK